MTPQQHSSPIKTYGTVAAIVVIFAIAYMYASGGSAPAGTLVATQAGGVGSSELRLLSQVRSFKIDTTLFSDPSFMSLQDFSVAITPENVGVRPNPFAPLPGEAVKSPAGTQPAGSLPDGRQAAKSK